MASCPAYAGPICSLCCSLDARCHDLCKPHARAGAQVSEALGKLLPEPIYARINSQFGRYLGVFAVSAGLVGLTLGLIYLQTSATIPVDGFALSDVLWKVFFALTIIIGVVAWLFVLAQQSRRAAEAETRRQTALLIQEIDAHKRTDAELLCEWAQAMAWPGWSSPSPAGTTSSPGGRTSWASTTSGRRRGATRSASRSAMR
mgnify:CR=1 FL=1